MSHAHSFSRFEAYEITNSRVDMMEGHSKSDTIEGIMKVENEVPREDEVNLDIEMVARVPEAYHFEGLMDTCYLVLSFMIYTLDISKFTFLNFISTYFKAWLTTSMLSLFMRMLPKG